MTGREIARNAVVLSIPLDSAGRKNREMTSTPFDMPSTVGGTGDGLARSGVYTTVLTRTLTYRETAGTVCVRHPGMPPHTSNWARFLSSPRPARTANGGQFQYNNELIIWHQQPKLLGNWRRSPDSDARGGADGVRGII